MGAEALSDSAVSGPVVIDASAVVEYLVASTLTESATRLLNAAAAGRVDLWAPDLVYSEAASALRRLVQLDALPAEAAGRAVHYLPRLPITTTGSAGLMEEVWRMREFLTPYDACYVALAGALGAVFVTGEHSLAAELGRRGRRARFLGEL